MKISEKISGVLFVLFVLVVMSCGNQKAGQPKTDETASVSRIEVSITGMTCTGCEQTISTGVSKLEGVSAVKADFKSGKAIVDFNPALADTSEIRNAITLSGYKVTGFNQITPSYSVN